MANKQTPAASFVPSIRQEKVNEVLSEVSQLKDKQEDMDTKLDTMKKENEALWREVVSLRQKHASQQKIVNKLIQVPNGPFTLCTRLMYFEWNKQFWAIMNKPSFFAIPRDIKFVGP